MFGVNGFSMASWAARLPAIRDEFALSNGRLGVVMLALSVGSIVILPFTGVVVRALRPARTVVAFSALAMAGITLVGFAPGVWVLALGLLLTGVGIGAWDVAMNVEGAEVERALRRSIMPRFHAAYSLGTVAGAGGGALAAGYDVPVRIHLPLVAGLVLAGGLTANRNFLSAAVAVGAPSPVGRAPGPTVGPVVHGSRASRAPGGSGGDSLLAAWTEPTTLLIGVLVFSMALAEGSANDWLALAVVDGYGADHAIGAVCFGVFVTGMTAMRMVGPALLDRYDHVLVMRCSSGFVLLGTAVVVAGAQLSAGGGAAGWFVVAAFGGLLWGLGAALGFPMGMTAAAADAEHSATRVGVVSTIGYTAFLAGPPLLGALGQQVGTATALTAVSLAVGLSVLTAGAIRQRPEQ